MRIAPVADVPGPLQKNYFFFLAAFFVDFLADFFAAALPAGFFLAFFGGFLRAMTANPFPTGFLALFQSAWLP